MLTPQDILEIEKRGISVSQVENQLQRLRQGIPPIKIIRPCRLNDGIIQLHPNQFSYYQQQFEKVRQAERFSKFIPASGAATRMFKDLLQFLQERSSPGSGSIQGQGLPLAIEQMWKHLQDFPFISDLETHFQRKGQDFLQLCQSQDMITLLQTLLLTPGLGYADLPKALLPFHRYPNGPRTSLEEHVHEAFRYLADSPGTVKIHLTVSPQYEDIAKAKLQQIQNTSGKSEVRFDLTISIQKPSTDTVALDSGNQPFRTDEGRLLFRPGGHGALLDNLNDIQGDIVFISNIDNVTPDYLKDPIVDGRTRLGGYLLAVQEQVFHHLQELSNAPEKDTIIQETGNFVQQDLQHQLSPSYWSLSPSERWTFLKQLLHRPIRVCGVVPNTGDPGGGPFWVEHADGTCSRQIVEQSQIAPQSESQQHLFASGTHFNPVDMVCAIRDYQGKPFNLFEFMDPETGFMALKSYQGRPLKALEWPGLWNGGMAHWLTLFVEIPRSTFNPVKTFLDWLHPNHQPLP
ncbi:MAG: DUF4301 family protein [Nitrospirales bacterium]